jgi:hypothetical protein
VDVLVSSGYCCQRGDQNNRKIHFRNYQDFRLLLAVAKQFKDSVL